MGKMSELHILLTGLVDDGVESGFFENRLKEYVMHEATSSHKISASLIEPFIDRELAECEEEIFDD